MKSLKDWRDIGACTVLYANGDRRYFDAFDDALRQVGWFKIKHCEVGRLGYPSMNPGRRCEDGRYVYVDWRLNWESGDPCLFVDEMGLTIPPWRVLEEARRLGLPQAAAAPRWRKDYVYTFRNGPVARTGVTSYWRCHRSVRTTQERLSNIFLNEFDDEAREYGIKARPRRASLLVHAWEDPPLTRYPFKNWKQYRRNQWVNRHAAPRR